jgi:hypothetical protein
MKTKLSQQAVMNVDKGEEIAGMWVTQHVPGSGIYKLAAKKKKDGTFAWAHFIHRDNGSRDVLFRGKANDQAQLDEVVALTKKNLKKFFNADLQPAGADMYTLDGKKISDTKH